MERRNKSKLTCCDLRREEASKRGVFQLRQHGSGYHNEEGADPTANCVGEREFQPIQKKHRERWRWGKMERGGKASVVVRSAAVEFPNNMAAQQSVGGPGSNTQSEQHRM